MVDGDASDLDARSMLASLTRPTPGGRRGQMFAQLATGLDAIGHLLRCVSGPALSNGEQTMAICHLLARGLTDMAAGIHLLGRGYVSQTYSVMRPVDEGCDLIALFARDSQEAQRWVQAKQAHKDFRPSAVRKRLGQASSNPMYDLLTEQGAHPRIAGANLTTALTPSVRDAADVELHVGWGALPQTHHATVLAYVNVLGMLMRLSGATIYLRAASASITLEMWFDSHIETVKAVAAGARLAEDEVVEVTRKEAQDVRLWSGQYDEHLDWLLHVRSEVGRDAAAAQ